MRSYSKLPPEKNRRLKLIEMADRIPLKVGDRVYVRGMDLNEYSRSTGLEECIVSSLCRLDEFGEVVLVRTCYGSSDTLVNVKREKIVRKTWDIGFDPFPKNNWRKQTRNLMLDNEGVLYKLFPGEISGDEKDNYSIEGHVIKETTLDPVITDADGNEVHIQRGYVWTLEDKRSLINSIYNGLSCGTILVRKHSWKEVEKKVKSGTYNCSFHDVIDGKQRLTALLEFVTDQFTDNNGWYFSELSEIAQREFLGMQSFTYSEMGEDSSDKDAIDAFICVNFAGVPQSKEHMEYLKNVEQNISEKK